MIHELLAEGRENGRTGKYLAQILGTDTRTITAQIERERREGQPICATSTGENAGYFLAASPEELRHYCSRLEHRENELNKTRQALLCVLRQLSGATIAQEV